MSRYSTVLFFQQISIRSLTSLIVEEIEEKWWKPAHTLVLENVMVATVLLLEMFLPLITTFTCSTGPARTLGKSESEECAQQQPCSTTASLNNRHSLAQQQPCSTTSLLNNILAQQQPCSTTASLNNSFVQQQPCSTTASLNNSLAQQQPCSTTALLNNSLAQQQPRSTTALLNNSLAQQQPRLMCTQLLLIYRCVLISKLVCFCLPTIINDWFVDT